MHVCVCRGGGTHEYCALSKRKNVSKRENITFRACICVYVYACACV